MGKKGAMWIFKASAAGMWLARRKLEKDRCWAAGVCGP